MAFVLLQPRSVAAGSVGYGSDGRGRAAEAAVAVAHTRRRLIVAGEAGIGVGERVASARIPAVEGRIAAQPPAQHEVVHAAHSQQHFDHDHQDMYIKRPAVEEAVR